MLIQVYLSCRAKKHYWLSLLTIYGRLVPKKRVSYNVFEKPSVTNTARGYEYERRTEISKMPCAAARSFDLDGYRLVSSPPIWGFDHDGYCRKQPTCK